MATKFKTKTAAQFRDDFLRSVRNGLITVVGIPNPNVSFGTDHYIIAEAIGKIAELASFNAITAADAQMADTATGEDLIRIGTIYGLSLKPAGSSAGNIILDSTQTVGIVNGQQLIDPNGLRYQISVGGIYADDSSVPLSSIDIGSGTNLAAGTVLRWVSPPAFVGPTALVATGGLIGGVDAESEENFRARILNRLRHPIGGGNWPQFAALAENSSTAVQKAYVYPAFNGPSTVQTCVISAPTDTNKNRDVNALIVTGTVTPAVVAGVFEGIEVTITTCVNIDADVSIGLTIPDSTSASPPGPGGGWLDGTPWPTPVDTTTNGANITAVTNSTTFTVNSAVAPTDNISQFIFITDDWQIIHSKVLFHTGSGPYNVTVETPCTGIAVGDWIFPDAVKMETYVNGLLQVFGNLGPGEITDIEGLLPHAFRRPRPTESNPSDIGPSILKFISNLGDEVLDVRYLYTPIISPPLPSNVFNGPNILVPKRIAFYPA